MADKTPKRPKARQAAAAAESGKPVKLRKNFQNEMSPADWIRYYLGLPQEYPMNPVLIEKGLDRLARVEIGDDHGPRPRRLTDFERAVQLDLHSAKAALYRDERQFMPHQREFVKRQRQKDMDRLVDWSSTLGTVHGKRASLERGESPMLKNLAYLPTAIGRVIGDRPDVFPSQEAAAAHMQRSGFRDPGETVEQARARARKAAAKRPHNPRMGQTKLKYGGY